VIVHPDRFIEPPGPGREWTVDALRNSKQIARETQFRGVTAFELLP
jgi:hypothetical protein